MTVMLPDDDDTAQVSAARALTGGGNVQAAGQEFPKGSR